MIPRHPLAECHPAIVALDDDYDRVEVEAANAAFQRVWAITDAEGRRLFHEFTCERRTSPAHVAFLSIFNRRVRDQMLEDTERHRKNAGEILDTVKKLGCTVRDPEPGQEVTVAVMRVADSMVLGDDPPPHIAVRREIVNCTTCGENCFSDPLTYGAGSPIFLCMRCLNPEINKIVEAAVATARESFTCARCGKTSQNPYDKAAGYCGNCHEFIATQ